MFKALQLEVDEFTQEGCFGTHYLEMESKKNAIRREISSELSPAESLADRVCRAGEPEAALYFYTRVLDVYRVLDTKAWDEVSGLLEKMAQILYKMGDTSEAEKRLWEILDLGDFGRKVQDCDQNLLKSITSFASKTSKALADPAQSSIDGPAPSNHQTPMPPLQKMMRSRYASVVVGNVFQSGPFPGTENSIVGGIETILDFIGAFSDDQLIMRDVQGRSPLYLAASLRQEGIGHGLIIRAGQLGWSLADRLTNARDISGQTILGCAILSNCTFTFIETLVKHGAEVDPDSPPPLPMWDYWTPLQNASSQGRLDVVKLLIEKGADPARGSFEQTPTDLAQLQGHDDIVQLLNPGAK